jgi:tetratricopeptide (TPR) repeat protein
MMFIIALISGCSAEAKKASHIAKGDKYFHEGKYKESIIEYKNVLQIEKNNPHATAQLGFAYFNLGDLKQAFPLLVKAKQLSPDNMDIRIKLAKIFLVVRQIDQARQEADDVLARDPKNFDGLLLMGDTAKTKEEMADAIQKLKDVESANSDKALFYLAVGRLYFKSKDFPNAETNFNMALQKDPKSVEAHMLLGDLFLVQNDRERTEQEYKTAADLSTPGSLPGIRLADFYMLTGRPDNAKQTLRRMTEKAPDYLPAFYKLAELLLLENDYDGCSKLVDAILSLNSSDSKGISLRGRIHLAKRETDDAVKDLQSVVKDKPKDARNQYYLALAYLQSGDTQQATAALQEAIAATPNYTDAIIQLAAVDIQTGSYQKAIDSLKPLVERQPQIPPARLLLGTAYLSKGEFFGAAQSLKEFIRLAPKDARGPYLLGLALSNQSRREEAKKQFEASLVLLPAFADPLNRLVLMDLEDKKPDAALKRVQKQVELAPNSAGLRSALGGAYLANKDVDNAKKAFEKAIELDPRLPQPYISLSELYLMSKDVDAALEKLLEVIKTNPKNTSALTLAGMIYKQQGDIQKAREMYEQALAADSTSVVATNNLAIIYSEDLGDIDKALDMAYRARSQAPDDPSIADTLGWILYKKGKFEWALPPLQASALKLPSSPEIQYHLGMTYYKIGKLEEARKALQQALAINDKFSGAEEAKKMLADM